MFNDPTTDHEEIFKDKLKQAVLKGSITPQQMKRFEKLCQRYKEIPNPTGGGGSLADAANIDPKDLSLSKDEKFIDEINMVTDSSFLKSTLKEFDSKYIGKVMVKDIFNKVLSLQKHGIAIQNYQINRVSKLGDEYDVHSVKLVPIEGEPSTITFKVPVIDEYGVYQSRSVKNRMRKQRIDTVIRKIDFDVVSLTSDISKMFVERSKFVAYSSDTWLRNQFVNIENKDMQIKWGSTKTIEEFDKNFDSKHGKKSKSDQVALLKRTPKIYSQISSYIKEINYKGRTFYFDVTKLEEHFGDEVVKAFNKSRDTQILVGKGKNTLIVLNNDGKLLEFRIDQDSHVELGSLESFLDFDVSKKPYDSAELVMSTKEIPIGVLLGYYVGLGNLMKTLKVNYQFAVKGGKRPTEIKEREVAIQFADGTLYIDVTNNYKAELIFGGFNRYKKHIKNFSLYEFDKKNVYSVVFAHAGLPGRFVREFNILRDMWIDPVSFEILKESGEPTDFVLLLIRAVELIQFDYHPAEMDRGLMRDRGYERIASFIYEEMIKSIRTHDSNPIKQNAKISMNPEAVWMRIISDETNSPIEESNPLHNIKESEIVVFRGSGGRSSRTMNSNSRTFTRNSIGVDSECTVDNGDAGTVRFLTANPNYTSLRGTVDQLDDFSGEISSTCLNTSLLLSPCGEYDDPKRRNFIQIQNSRTTNSEGAMVLPVRTGYERVVPYRCSDLYAKMAEDDGTVTNVTEKAISVKYKSGKEVTVELGKRDGKWSGKIIPHTVITNLKVNQKIKKGDAIAFNPMFFEIDTLGGTLAYKSGTLCRVGLVEEAYTFEDGSAISADFAAKLTTKNSDERIIEVTFDKEVNELVKVGDVVEYDTALCILQNNIGDVQGAYSKESLESLKGINALNPRAKKNGVVSSIEAVYVGDVENMSPSLQAIVSRTDRDLYKKAKDLNKERNSGQKNANDRFFGKILEPDTVYIKISIDVKQTMGNGSKVVYGYQMKSVVSNIFTEAFTTEDGKRYDGLFSMTSFVKRVVESSLITGCLNSAARKAGQTAWEIYEGK